MKKMTKRVKSLIAASVAVVVLGGALAVLIITGRNTYNDGKTSSSEEPKIYLTSDNYDEVKSIEIKNKKGEYLLERMNKEEDDSILNTESTTAVTEEGDFTIKALEKYGVATTFCDYAADYAAGFYASIEVEASPEDIAKYGFNDPQSTVKVNYKDGSSEVVIIGDATPDANGYYVKKGSSDAVYASSISAISDYFLAGREKYINTNLTSAAPDNYDDDDAKVILAVMVKHGKEEFSVIPNKDYDNLDEDDPATAFVSEYALELPYADALDYELAAEYINGYYSMSAYSIEMLDPKQSDLKTFGIDDPSYAVEIKYSNQTKNTILWFGDTTDDGFIYCFKSGTPLIYKVRVEYCHFIDMDPFSIVNKQIVLPYIEYIEKVDIICGGKTHTFELSGTGDSFAVRYNGNKIDNYNFKQFYQLMLDARREEWAETVSSSTPKLTIVYHYKDLKREKDTIEFIQTSARKMCIKLNGVGNAQTRMVYVDKVISEVNKLINGQDVDINW